jgi:hypothetical protein
MLSRHPFRQFYFAGRLFSYSLAGLAAGEAGAVLTLFLKPYHFSEAISIAGGLLIVTWGLSLLFNWHFFKSLRHPKIFGGISNMLSTLLLKNTARSTFFFGTATVLLPCGQTLIVFSACALLGDPAAGLFNGFAFALLTTPSLLFAMHAFSFFKTLKSHANSIMAACAIAAGVLACCRGFAELGWIPHFVLNPGAKPLYHIVIY